MKQIPLTQGKFALVDDADFEWLNKWKWFADKGGRTFYAARMSSPLNGKQTAIRMHREILGLKFGDSKQTDHIDHNGLNNCRVNLRACTKQQNRLNSQSRRNSSSRFKGVYWNRRERKWHARITYSGRRKHLGYFADEIEAAETYDKTAKRLFGEFARPNFSGDKK